MRIGLPRKPLDIFLSIIACGIILWFGGVAAFIGVLLFFYILHLVLEFRSGMNTPQDQPPTPPAQDQTKPQPPTWPTWQNPASKN